MLPFHVEPILHFGLHYGAPILACVVVFAAVRNGWRFRGSEVTAWAEMGLLLVFASAHRLLDIQQPFSLASHLGALSAAQEPPQLIAKHLYDDPVNGPLYYLLIHPLSTLGDAAVRLPSILASLLTFVALYSIASRSLGARWSMVPVLLLAVSPLYLFECLGVSSIPLFIALMTVSTWFLLESLEDPETPELLFYGVFAASMWWTNVALTPLVLIAHLTVVGLHTKGSALRWFGTIALTTLLATPELLHVADALADLTPTADPRDAAALARGVLYPSTPWAALVLLAPVMGALRTLRGPADAVQTFCLSLLVATSIFMSYGMKPLGMPPEHLLFALPALAILGTHGILGLPTERSWSLAPAVSAIAAGATLLFVLGQSTDYASMQSHARRPPAQFEFDDIRAAIDRGPRPRRIVADIGPFFGIARYAMPDKAEFARTCQPATDWVVHCTDDVETISAVTEHAEGRLEGWKQRALDRLRTVPAGPWWFVEDRAVDNDVVVSVLTDTCNVKVDNDRLRLWFCEEVLTTAMAVDTAEP